MEATNVQQPDVHGDVDDDYDDIPLQHQKPFGSGLHKKAISFVPASDGQLNSTDQISAKAAPRPEKNVADLYLSLVLPEENRKSKEKKGPEQEQQEPPPKMCEICRLPLDSPAPEGQDDSTSNNPPTTESGKRHRQHETSLAHQLCLPHSHPPSALDRSRMGLTYLSTYGWDPDSRKGLGSAQQGIQFPVKGRFKDDTLGIGIHVPKNLPPTTKKKKEPELLDAGKVRKQAREEKRKAERIRRQLFGRHDEDLLEKYLGPGAAGR